MSYCTRSRRRWFTVLNFKSWAYSRIYGHFQQHFTAHAQKRLFINFRCKFRHRRSIHRPRFPIRAQNFGDLATFSVDFCILYAECPPHFYFRFVWPTDLESIPHASTPTSIILTKFKVDMTIHCRVIAFVSADTSRDFVTLTFWPWIVEVHGGSRDQLCYQVWRPYAYPFMSYDNYIFGIPDPHLPIHYATSVALRWK